MNVEEEMKIFSLKMAEKNLIHYSLERLEKEIKYLQ